jgi:hypothetical protein
MSDIDILLKKFNDRMIYKIDEILSTLIRLPQHSFNILSYKIKEPVSGLGYTVSLKSDDRDIINMEVTNIDQNEIMQYEREAGNAPESMSGGFNLDDTLQMKLTIEDNDMIPLDQLLEACEMIAKTNMIPYVKIVDYSKLNYCEGTLEIDYSLLHVLTYGVSWYGQHGYKSLHHTSDTTINRRTIDGTMGSLLEKLFGSMSLSDKITTLNQHISKVDSGTFSMDMKVSVFFKQILDYFQSLLENPNKIVQLCNSDPSIDQREYSTGIISVFNIVRDIMDRLNDQMANDEFQLLSYDRTLFKKVIHTGNDTVIDDSEKPSVEQSSSKTVPSTVEQPTTKTVESTVEQPSTESVPSNAEQPSTETMPSIVEQPSTETVESNVEQPSTETVESNVENPSTEPSTKTIQPTEESPNEKETSNEVKGVFNPVIKGGSAHPNVDLIRLPFNGGGKTLKRKRKNKTNKKIKKNKHHSRHLKDRHQTKKWNFLNLMS